MIYEQDFYAIDLVSMPISRTNVPAVREFLTSPDTVGAFEGALSKTYCDQDDRVLACMGVAPKTRECWAIVADDYRDFPIKDRIDMVSLCKATLLADVKQNGRAYAQVDGSRENDVRFLLALGFKHLDNACFILDV